MSKLGYGYGSEWHILHWLGYHRNELNAIVERAIIDGKAEALSATRSFVPESIGSSKIHWLDVPWSGKSGDREQNREWQGIQFISDTSVKAAWSHFWPQRGTAQCWDAVGIRNTETGPEWLLVEAKAHTDEMYSSCGATESSATTIRSALQSTRDVLGIETNNMTINDAWLCRYYQYANRLAALHFLNNVAGGDRQPIRARLLMIYVTGECMSGRNCPASANQWDEALDSTYQSLGLIKDGITFRKSQTKPSLMNLVHEVYLPVSK